MSQREFPALVSLEWHKSGDTRKPIVLQLFVEDVDTGRRTWLELDEHQAAHLLSGTMLSVQAQEIFSSESGGEHR